MCIQPTKPNAFREFLRRPSFQNAFDDPKVARDFIRGIRDGILHEGETRGWIIWREEPEGEIVSELDGKRVLNRKLFCTALRSEFDSYGEELNDAKNVALRDRFIEQFDGILKES
jgi:hypothetical protein